MAQDIQVQTDTFVFNFLHIFRVTVDGKWVQKKIHIVECD